MGFAAEIKEFLGAAKDSWKLMSDTELKDAQKKNLDVKTAAEQKEMDDPLNQQLKEAKLAHTRATTANIGRESPLQALQRKALQLELDARANPQPSGPATVAGQTSIIRPAIGAPPKEDPDAVQGTGFAKGGLIQKFAVGGMVDEEDLEDDEGALPPQAIPTAGTGFPAIGGYTNKPGMLTPTQQPQRRAAAGAIPTPQARPPNAVDDALKYGATQIQQLPAIGSARQRAVRGYAQGAGAAPMDDLIQVYRKIDPKGEMGESERNLYALQAVHQFKMNQGDAQGAAQTAFQMLQTYKVAATRYAAIAAAAMKEGHVDEGMKAAIKAYAQVPDGNDMKLYRGKDGRIGYELTDKDGNKVAGGLATPDEIGSAAMKLATPGGFENHLVQMSSGAKLGGKGVGGPSGKKAEDPDQSPGPPKPKDYGEIKQEQVDTDVDKWHDAMKADPESKGKELTPKELATTKNMLYHVRRSNDVTNDEGLRRLQTIITAAEPTKKGEAPPFRAVENKEAKTHTIMFPDGGELTIPSSEIGMFKTARAEHFAQVAKEAKEAAEKAARPDGLKMADEAFNKSALETGEAVKGAIGAIPEAVSKSTLGAVGRGVGRVADEASKWLGTAGKTIKEEGGAGAIAKGVGNVLGGGSATAAPAPPDEDRPL